MAMIRRARPEDLKAVQDLNYELFVSDNRHFDDLNLKWPYEEEGMSYFKRLCDGEYGVCFVAEDDGRLVGYLAGVKQRPHSAYKGVRAELENMCVTDEYRGHGIGKELVGVFRGWCKDERVDVATVNAFSPNTRAIEFYGQQGFEPYSENLWMKI